MSKHLPVSINLTYEEQMGVIGNRVALESQHLAGFAKTVGEVIPNLARMTVGFLKGQTFSPIVDYPELGSNVTRFLRLIESQQYANISPTTLAVPEGFDGDMVEYVGLLSQSAEHVSLIVSRVLKPYNDFLSSLLSTPAGQVSTYDTLAFLTKLDKERELLNKRIGEHFSTSNKSEAPMSKVVRRNRDWAELVIKLREAEQTINSVTNAQVQKGVNGCVALLDTIKGSAESQQLDNISAEMVQALAKHTLSVAKEVEFYSLTSHRIAVLKNATAENIKKLEKLFG